MMADLAPHQWDAFKKLHNGSILRGGVGSGKTRVAMAYYVHEEAPRDIIVITTAKKRDSVDWETEAAHFGIGKTPDATLAGVLTVDSWNNIGRYTDVRGAFFVFDEQRLVGSGMWSKSFIQIAKANHWIMLSATPGDTWLDYVPVFIANGFYRNRTEFKREHCVYSHYGKYPKLERYIGLSKLVRQRNDILVEMPYKRHTTRKNVIVPVDYDVDIFELVTKKRWHPWENRPIKDAGELFALMRKVVNTDPSRLGAVQELMKKHPKLIVFYNFDYELEMLRTLPSSLLTTESLSGFDGLDARPSPETLSESSTTQGSQATSSSSFALSEWNGHRHDPIPNTDRWVYLVQYVAGAESWNCTDTDAMCFFSLTYSYKNYHQAHGRIDRMNTPFTDLYYYTLLSNSLIDKAVAKSLGMKKSFNESDFGPMY
jgi:hypothetical protein